MEDQHLIPDRNINFQMFMIKYIYKKLRKMTDLSMESTLIGVKVMEMENLDFITGHAGWISLICSYALGNILLFLTRLVLGTHSFLAFH